MKELPPISHSERFVYQLCFSQDERNNVSKPRSKRQKYYPETHFIREFSFPLSMKFLFKFLSTRILHYTEYLDALIENRPSRIHEFKTSTFSTENIVH